MSTDRSMAHQALPRPGGAAERATGTSRPARSRLTLVAVPAPHPPRAPFFGLVVLVLGVGLLLLLLLNTVLAQDAFVLDDLQKRSAALADREQALAEQVAVAAAPQRLAQRARELGMVASDAPAFLRTADGAVLGSPAPASGQARTPVVSLTGAPATPSPGPGASTKPTAKPNVEPNAEPNAEPTAQPSAAGRRPAPTPAAALPSRPR